jgi:hypothetical protein
MPDDPITLAQRGVPLADAALTGPLLAPRSLTAKDRLQLLDGLERLLDGAYAHLPLKRARYGFDPVQRLRILRTLGPSLGDDAFHQELVEVMTGLRDAHTVYAGPASLEGKVAVLPFLVERTGPVDSPDYLVTKVGPGLDRAFRPGVVLEHWNGVPVDRAVLRLSSHLFGGRPDSARAWATQGLTLRSLRYGPPPDEEWVVVGYRTEPSRPGAAGTSRSITFRWTVIDPNQVAGRPARAGRRARGQGREHQHAMGVSPAAEEIRRAKMLLFAPQSLTGRSAPAAAPPRRPRRPARRGPASRPIETRLPTTLRAAELAAPDGPFGYLRIFGFDTPPDPFVAELVRLAPLLPDRGLVIDIRANPGGYIVAAERALQLFTPRRIEPTRFSALATPFVRQIAGIGPVVADLKPWRDSLEAAVRNGEPYSRPIPLTDPAGCNDLGQLYGGPVLLVADSTTYSSGDLFSAGFVDNGLGPFVCVGTATGAGGANVWDYGGLRQALAGSAAALPALPDGISVSFAYRRATRSGPAEGTPIEDVGIEGEPYRMTADDVLGDNADLLAFCLERLRQQPFSRLSARVDRRARQVAVTAEGLDRVDLLVDGHPGASVPLGAAGRRPGPAQPLRLDLPAGARELEVLGYAGDRLSQRRRLTVAG